MCTAAYKVDVASDRRRHENVPRHIFLFNNDLISGALNYSVDAFSAKSIFTRSS